MINSEQDLAASRAALTEFAKTATVKEWNARYPPRPSREHEPPDASGFSEWNDGDDA